MTGPLDTGILYRDDNLAVLQEFPDECVDLIYLDPPFFSNRFYEVIWGDEAEVRSFEDRWAGGIQHYVDWMRERVLELHRVLRSTGSLYLHCDPHASHYLKVMLDGVFGMPNFRNEIIWKRTSAHSSAKRYGPVHDVILFYGKSSKTAWYGSTVPHDPEYVESFFRQVEAKSGRRFHANVLTGSGIRRGESGQPWRGYDPTAHNRHWAIPGHMIENLGLAGLSLREKLDALDAAGRVWWPKKKGGSPRLKYYEDTLRGQPAADLWTNPRPISGNSAERLGYPTQKPEALLERIIGASSKVGDVVLDPFCGCGTTVAVAERLKRQWVGIDISATAVEIMRRRLVKQGRSPRIENSVQTVTDLQQLKPFEFQNWIINAIYGTHSPKRVGDMGIDGYWFFTRDPVQVKQSEGVGRNVVDNFETAIRRAGHDTGYIIAFSFTRGAVEEATRAKNDGLDIRLIKVAEVLLLVKRPHGRLGPQPASIAELPLPPRRKPQDMPSADELVKSDREAVG